MATIFISHSERDLPVANEIIRGLEAAGYSTWYFERDMVPGTSYLSQIAQAIERSQAVVLVVSSDALDSDQVSKEVVGAFERRKPFFPVLVDMTPPQLKERQPEWRHALGSTTMICLSTQGIQICSARIIDGLKSMGIQPEAAGMRLGVSRRAAPTPAPTPTPTRQPSMLRMNMKSYANHDELSYSNTLGNVPYDQRIIAIRPEFVIDNPPHGLYGEMEEKKYPGEGYKATWLLQNIAGYHAAGIEIIGYISGGYEGKGGGDHYSSYWYSLNANKMLITNMATIDHVDGVFVDECSDYPNAASRSYLTELSNLAHSYGMIVWMNTGVDDFDEWYFTVADFVQSSEGWVGQSLSLVQQKYGSKISVAGFNSPYTVQDAYRLTIDAWCKGLAYCYINTAEYTSIAPWFEEYAQMLGSCNSCPTPTG